MTPKKTDTELVEAALRNSDEFGKLMTRYESKLARFIRRITNFDQATVEDILQEAFIKIYQNLNGYNPSLSFSAWAYRIVHNEAINHFRKTSHYQIIPLETDDEDGADLIDILTDKTDIPADLSKADKSKEVRLVLSMLSPKYREILVLKFLEELTYEEISDVLHIPMGTVATLIGRAKKQFKMIIAKNHINFD